MQHPDVSALYEWLVDGAPGARGPEEVVARMAPALVAGGVPVARVAAFVRTLHPHIMGRRFTWTRGTPAIEVREAPYVILGEDTYRLSPAGRVWATGQELRVHLDGREPLEMADLVALAAEGYTDYVALPLRFLDGQVHAITCATDAPGGYTDAQLAALRHVMRPLARIAEILALRRTATNLLSAYVGRNAGERILGGQVQRGDTESIRCVVWFSDLRDFTGLSTQRAPMDVILLLNRVFDCQVPAVERGGGEVLKFMGDGMLAVFPVGDDAPRATRAAIAAAHAALAALDELNARGDGPKLDFGVGLHVGEVAYGNVGGIARLDFTCIGAAVNLASRIEHLTGPLGRRLLVSADIAALVPDAVRPVGTFPLKGVAEPQQVFEAPVPGIGG